MIDWALTAALCAALVAVGWPWARALGAAGASAVATAGLAYLAGAALVTLALLLWNIPGLGLGRPALAFALLGTAVGGVLLRRRLANGTAAVRPPAPGAMLPALAPLGLALAALAYGLVQAGRLGPVDHIDFLKAWGLKALSAIHEGNFHFSELSGPHLFYPLEVSNLNAAVYLALGHANDSVVRLPGALFGVSLAAVMWWLLRPVMPPVGAACAVALAVTPPEFTTSMTNGLADLTTAAYLGTCSLAAYRWLLDGDETMAALSGFAAGGAAWTKLEGAPSALVVLAAVLLVRRAWRPPGAGRWVVWFLVFTVPWQLYQRIYDIPPNRSHFKRVFLDVGWIVSHVARTLGETTHWGVFWPLALGLVAGTAPLWWRSRRGRYLAAVALPNVVLTLGAYVTHYRAGIAGSVEATAHRLYLHAEPPVAAMAVLAVLLALERARAASDAGRAQDVEVREAGHHEPVLGRDHG